MISDKLLTEYSYLVSARFEAINTRYIKLMANQIKEIGTLNATNIHRLEQMLKMNSNIEEINTLLAMESHRTLNELYKVYDMSGMSLYGDTLKYYTANGKIQVPFEQNSWIQNYLEGVKNLTASTFNNLSQTTTIFESYRNLVDTAIDTVATGQQDYQSVIRHYLNDNSLNNLVKSPDGGLRVQYTSGRTRRLDSAIRMNVLDGVRQVYNGIREQTGREFGADGVEISAHGLCAADHINIQGKQYSKIEFTKLNESLSRPISTCNCKHSIYPIVLGISKPAHSKEELKEYKYNSEQKFEINGKEYTKYEASQLMRKMETEMRYAKDRYIFGTECDMSDIADEAKEKLKLLRTKYNEVTNITGLEKRYDKAYVPGFKGIGNPKPKNIVLKPITS